MNVLIVGLGSIAQKHIAALRVIDPLIQIYALRSSHLSESIEGVTNLYSIEEVRMVFFDFAIVSNPTSEHQKSIQQIVGLEIPLFIEKPLFHRLSIRETVVDVERKGILTYVACNLRFLEALQYAKQYVDAFKYRINEVNAYCGSYLPDWRKGANYKENYSAIPELGGGVHIDLIHEIDYLYWMFGVPLSSQKVFSNVSSLGIRACDYANYCMTYPTFNVSVILNYYRRDARRSLELVCENETINVNLLENTVHLNNQLIFQSDKRILDTYREQLLYFICCVQERKKTFNTITDAYKVLQICLKS